MERNLEYFQRQKFPWLRTFLQEIGIQTSSEGKGKRKAEVELVFNTHSMKITKMVKGDHGRFIDHRRGCFARTSIDSFMRKLHVTLFSGVACYWLQEYRE